MPERVVFLPTGFIYGLMEAEVEIPAARTLVAELRSHFDLEIAFVGGPQTAQQGSGAALKPPPSVDQAVRNLRASILPGAHLVVMAWHSLEALLALDGMREARSLVLLGFHAPTATLRAAGMGAVADANDRFTKGRDSSYPFMRLVFQGLDDEAVRSLSSKFDAVLNWESQRDYVEWWTEIDLLKVAPRIEAPVLYLHSPLDLPGMRDLVLQLIPHAEVDRLDSFPTRLQDADSGSEAAGKIIPFIQRQKT